MNYISERINRNLLLLILGDIFIISISIYLSTLFRFDFNIPNEIKNLMSYQNFIWLSIIKIFCFRIFSLYRGMWRYTSVWDMINIFKANLLSTFFIIIVINYFIGFKNFSESLIVIDFIVCTGAISISRLGIRIFFSQIREFTFANGHQYEKKNILLVGAGDTGQTILRQTLQKSNLPIRIIGIIDDNSKKINQRLHGISILGAVKDMKNLKLSFDEIYICTPSATRKQMRTIVEECKKTKKPFK